MKWLNIISHISAILLYPQVWFPYWKKWKWLYQYDVPILQIYCFYRPTISCFKI